MSTDHGGVACRELRRSFGPVHAVRGVDLDARPGEVTALVGPNGSGKTTLLLVLATLLVPDGGTVRVAGFDPVTQPREVRARMGWSPDEFGVYDDLTAREYATFHAQAHRLPSDQIASRVGELLDLLRLDAHADEPVSVLSRGQKQRLGLSRALVHGPSVLLLDEPAAGLDPRARVDLRRLLRRTAAAGAAVLVSSHVLGDLEEVADRVVFLDGGRSVASGPVATLAPAARTWRLRALDDARLTAALADAAITWTPAPGGGADVVVGSEEQAAVLLADLVGAGVPVSAFAPVGSTLEAAYLELTERG